jgi:hypothetical protein
MKQQRSTLEKRNVLEEGQKRGCCGSTELAIVVARRSWREISLWKTGDRHRKKKREGRRQFPQAPQSQSTPNLFQAAIHLRKVALLSEEWGAP